MKDLQSSRWKFSFIQSTVLNLSPTIGKIDVREGVLNTFLSSAQCLEVQLSSNNLIDSVSEW